jgi:predicted 2-oxoglutarate/Fe(II)-dependent dioxygenase YbiX
MDEDSKCFIKINNSIVIYRNGIENPKKVLNQINTLSELNTEYAWRDSLIYHGDKTKEKVNSFRSSKQIDFFRSNESNEVNYLSSSIFNVIDRSFSAALRDYTQRIGIAIKAYEQDRYSTLKYELGDFFSVHLDTSPILSRVISGLMYLNDDYDGGILEFPKIGLELKPKEGDIIFFPSQVPFFHQSTPITKGIKYAAVAWWN